MVKAATGFPPVIDDGVETLILGSFPGVASLGKAQYYAHPQNQFWRLVGAVIDEPLPVLDYADRLHTLLKHRIGLWDVIGSCVRWGSLDANIRQSRQNDFARVTGVARNLRRIFFNGQTAGRFAWQFAGSGYEVAILPSSSPAYTLGFDEKLVQWQQIAMPLQPARRSVPGRRSSALSAARSIPQAAGPKC